MARGPWVPDVLKREIATIYLKARDEDGVTLSAPMVHEEVMRRLHERGRAGIHPIKLRTVQQILTDVRKNSPQRKDVDGPWSMAVSARSEFGIPLEATKDLLGIWKSCFAAGRTLTIREAQWIARLRGIVPSESLFPYGVIYASQERASRALKQTFDTTYLDSLLAFASKWESETAELTLRTPRPETHDWLESLPALSALEAEIWPELDVLTIYLLLKRDEAEMGQRLMEERLGGRIGEAITVVEMPAEAATVFGLWLRRIAETERWQRESFEEHFDTALKLREIVRDEAQRRQTKDYDPQPDWTPAELLERYGLE